MTAGNFWQGLQCPRREVTVNVCGVAVTMPQGQSRVPNPSTGQQGTWEPSVCVPRSSLFQGRAGIGTMPAEGAGGAESP